MGITVNFVSRKIRSEKNTFTSADINANLIAHHLLIINATPVGMFPNINDCLPIPFQYLTPDHLVIDLIYNPSETSFLKKAKENGAKTMNGLDMLYAQAEKSWKIWEGKKD